MIFSHGWKRKEHFYCQPMIAMPITITRVKMYSHAYLDPEKSAWKNKSPGSEETLIHSNSISTPPPFARQQGLACCYFPVASQLGCSFTVCACTKSAGRFVVARLKGVYPDAVNHSGSAALLITGQSRRSQAHTVHTHMVCACYGHGCP